MEKPPEGLCHLLALVFLFLITAEHTHAQERLTLAKEFTYLESAKSTVPNGNLIDIAKQISSLNENWSWGWTTWSGSMRPSIDGNTIFVGEKNVYDDLSVGDLVSYRSFLPGRGFVLHRIIARQGDDWIVKGDNNALPDLEMVTRANFDMRVFITMTSSEEPPHYLTQSEASISEQNNRSRMARPE